MEFNHGNGSNKHLNQNPEVITPDFGKSLVDGNSLEFFSPPYASSSFISSQEPGGTNKNAAVDVSSSTPQFDLNFLSGPESVPFGDNGLHPFQDMPSVSPDGEALSMDPQMKSPPVQTMGRPSDYDPNRIPASIFSSKASNPTEWSTTSNESLFSIHMGNNSFSRDHAILFGKSGEFSKFDDWNLPPPSALPNVPESKTNELSTLPPVMEVSAHEESSVRSGNVSRIEEDSPKIENHTKEKVAPVSVDIVPASPTNATDVKGFSPSETNLDPSKKHKPSYSNPRLSGESGHSGSSFAFPVLVNDSGKAGSLKAAAATEKSETPKSPQIVPKETDKATPKATTPTKVSDERWFSCFPWRPRCC